MVQTGIEPLMKFQTKSLIGAGSLAIIILQYKLNHEQSAEIPVVSYFQRMNLYHIDKTKYKQLLTHGDYCRRCCYLFGDAEQKCDDGKNADVNSRTSKSGENSWISFLLKMHIE
jgi:hypothetical protein